MRTRKVTRHYCEFCAKGSFKKPTMAEHEAQCFMNPGRKCGLCEKALGAEVYERLVKELVSLSVESDSYITEPKTYEATVDGVKWLRREVYNCPACMLAVLRQSRVMAFEHFDYKKERDKWWQDKSPYG